MTDKSYDISKEIKVNTMGKLIIDGNSFFEIDEECIKKNKISKECGLDKYLKDDKTRDQKKETKERLRK